MPVCFPNRHPICWSFFFWALWFYTSWSKNTGKQYCENVSNNLVRVFSFRSRKSKEIIRKNFHLNSWNLSQIFLCSLRERSCLNSYYNYPCKHLIVSTTKIYFQNFEKRKWTIWSNNFFQPRQLITKANQVGVRDQRIKLVKQLKDIYARYIVTIYALMHSSINLRTYSRIK